jgi:hypothetical protein
MFSGNKKSKKRKRGRNKTSYRQHKRWNHELMYPLTL